MRMSSRKWPHSRVVTFETLKKPLIIHKERQKKLMSNECLYIRLDIAKLYVQFFRPLAQCAVSLEC